MEVVGASPWLWIVTAVCPVAAGALASFFPDRIKVGYYSALWPQTSFDGVATAFWGAVALAGLSFGIGQWAQSRAGANLRTMVRRLQTLPPGGFLDSFREAFQVSARQSLLMVVSDDVSLPAIDQAIRNVLGAIVEVARDFDEQGSACYGANLMIWRKQGEPFESLEPCHVLPYHASDPAVSGHLELVVELSTTTALRGNDYAVDPSVVPLVLPIPWDHAKLQDARTRSRDPVIPGAPQAFVHGELVVFESVQAYISWLDDQSSRGLEVVNPLKEYFLRGQGKAIKSFASRPIVSVNPTVGRYAVLNLHSDQENLLVDSGQTLFAPLIEPFCFLLALLLDERMVLASAEIERKAASTSPPSADPQGSALTQPHGGPGTSGG
jgi:hypothetical protein